MEIVYLIIGLIIGFVIAWLILKNKFLSEKGIPDSEFQEEQSKVIALEKEKEILENNLALEKRVSNEKIQDYANELNELKEELNQKNQAYIEVSNSLSARQEELKQLHIKIDEQKSEIDEIQKKFTMEFENLANKIFEDKSLKFTEQNKVNLDNILKPLSEKIKDFERKVEDTYNHEARQRASLQGEIKQLVELNNKVSIGAENLTKALKGDSKTQGDWGELVLENILEYSGLIKDREYFIQKSFTNEFGSNIRPDVIVKFPGNRNVVVDSKVSLTAYERYFNAEDKSIKEKFLKEHIKSIKKHVDELDIKDYQNLYQLESLDFVIMFVPIEPAYLLAINSDNELWTYAYEKRVLLISPTNIIAILKMVESLWQKEYQNQNALEIAKKSGDLYDKFVNFVKDLQDIGKKIEDSQKAYDNAMNKLQKGRGNLINRAETLRKMGAKAKKQLPKSMIENNSDNSASDTLFKIDDVSD